MIDIANIRICECIYLVNNGDDDYLGVHAY